MKTNPIPTSAYTCNGLSIRDENGTDIFRSYLRPNSFRGSDLSVSESEYSISDTVFVSEYLYCIFIMSTSNHILSDIVDIIYIRIRPKI